MPKRSSLIISGTEGNIADDIKVKNIPNSEEFRNGFE